MKLTPEQHQQITAIVPHAEKVAGKLCPGDDEARSLAYLAICEAIQKYDPNRGMTVRTYCLDAAKHALQQYKAGRTNNGNPGKGRWKNDHKVRQESLSRPDLAYDGRDHGIEQFEIDDLLTVLPKTYREIFRRHVLEGEPVLDIIREKGISKSRAYMILKRCKERLRRELDG